MPIPMVAGNWKMNASRESVATLLSDITAGSAEFAQDIDLVVFPPYIYIPETQARLANAGVKWGAQNLSNEQNGALTGEVSGAMLKDWGCTHVLVGHSERRQRFHETNTLVAEKFHAAQQAGLTPILCVGETLAEREQGRTGEVVLDQLHAVMNQYGVRAFASAVLAYEPVWAIGTGKTATPSQAQEVHAQLRASIAKENADIAANLQILYGGSVKASNAGELFAMNDIDGSLVGGASLNGKEFLGIAQAAKSKALENM